MRRLGWLIFSAGIAGPVLAGPGPAVREFPADAKRAIFSVVQYPTVKLYQQTVQMAPGAQIRDEANLIVQASTLTGRFRVLYTLDGNGNVYRVWILTPDEQAIHGPQHWFVPW